MNAPDLLTDREIARLRACIVWAGNALASMGPDAQSESLYESSLEVWQAQNVVKNLIAAQIGRLFATGKMVDANAIRPGDDGRD